MNVLKAIRITISSSYNVLSIFITPTYILFKRKKLSLQGTNNFLIIKHKIQSMSKPIYFLPWAMRMVIILCLVITHIQQDSLVYILSALTLILIVFCIWGCSKSKTQNILKALTGNRTQNIFDIVMSALAIIIGLYSKDTTTVIEGGALLTISVINIISPIKYQKS